MWNDIAVMAVRASCWVFALALFLGVALAIVLAFIKNTEWKDRLEAVMAYCFMTVVVMLAVMLFICAGAIAIDGCQHPPLTDEQVDRLCQRACPDGGEPVMEWMEGSDSSPGYHYWSGECRCFYSVWPERECGDTDSIPESNS